MSAPVDAAFDLRPDEPLCAGCLGTGGSRWHCSSCVDTFDAVEYCMHSGHETWRFVHCRTCGGSGKLVDALRRRMQGKLEGPTDFRALSKAQISAWMQAAYNAALTSTLLGTVCSASPTDPSTSSPLILKPPGGKTSP